MNKPATGCSEGEKNNINMKKLFLLATAMLLVVVVAACRRENQSVEPVVPEGFAFGIDVSQYNGDIDWAKVASQKKTKDPIKFVIIRSSAGVNKDRRYEKNYKGAKENGFIVGSYHYYRPNENSAKQFESFKRTLHLEKGDILPVVDIEVPSRVQSMSSLKVGLRKFVNLCEEEYGVKPIIYTKLSMWRDYLQDDFADCQLWVAAYTESRRDDDIVKNASIHQFTRHIKNIPGIPEKWVDGDDCKDLSSIIFRW